MDGKVELKFLEEGGGGGGGRARGFGRRGVGAREESLALSHSPQPPPRGVLLDHPHSFSLSHAQVMLLFALEVEKSCHIGGG